METGDDSSRSDPRRRIEEWSVAAIADAVDGRLAGEAEVRPMGVSIDSRTLEVGELFVAIRGDRFDGHAFVDDAVEAGACAVLADRAVEADVPVVRVDDTVESLGDLGEALWREAHREGMHTIDVTGSNGKTTTKELLRALWSSRGAVSATPGNYNNRIGLPLTLCRLPADCDHLILELGANAEGEIAELVRRAPGQERVITSIGADHLAGFGSVAGVRRAKAEIAECSEAATTVVVPASEREKLPLAGPAGICTFGPDPTASVRVEAVREGSEDAPTEVDLRYAGRRRTFPLGLPGWHNAENLAAAVATGVARQIEFPAEVDRRLAQLELPGGRWRRSGRGAFDIVDDAYNANPSSVRASIRAFAETAPRGPARDGAETRRIAILGEMAELGEASGRLHEEVARDVASRPAIDVFCAVGADADRMAEAAREAAPSTRVVAVADVDQAGEWLRGRGGPAMVWLKASRSAELERVVDRLEDQ